MKPALCTCRHQRDLQGPTSGAERTEPSAWLTSSIPKTWPLQVLATASAHETTHDLLSSAEATGGEAAQVSAPRFRPPLNATSAAGAGTVDTVATEQVAVRLAGAMDMGTDVGKRGARLHEQPAYRARSMLLHLESSLPLPARTSSSVNLRRQSLSEAKTARALLLGVAGLRDRRPQEAVSMKKGKIQSPARCPAQTWLHVSTRSFMRSFSSCSAKPSSCRSSWTSPAASI